MSSLAIGHNELNQHPASCPDIDALGKNSQVSSTSNEREGDSHEQSLRVDSFLKERFRNSMFLEHSADPQSRRGQDVENFTVSTTTTSSTTNNNISNNKTCFAKGNTSPKEIPNSEPMTNKTKGDGSQECLQQTQTSSTNSLSGPERRIHKPLARRQDSSTLDVDLKAAPNRRQDEKRRNDEQTEGHRVAGDNDIQSLRQEQCESTHRQALQPKMQNEHQLFKENLTQFSSATCQNQQAQIHGSQSILGHAQGAAASSPPNFKRSFSQPQTRADGRYDLTSQHFSSSRRCSSAQKTKAMTSNAPTKDNRVPYNCENVKCMSSDVTRNPMFGYGGELKDNTNEFGKDKREMFTQSFEPLTVDIEKNESSKLKLKSHDSSNGTVPQSEGKEDNCESFVFSISHGRLVFLVFGLSVIILLQGCAMGLVGKEAWELHNKVQALELKINKLEEIGYKFGQQDSQPLNTELFNFQKTGSDLEYVYRKVLQYADPSKKDLSSIGESGQGNPLIFDGKNSHASVSKKKGKHGLSVGIHRHENQLENLEGNLQHWQNLNAKTGDRSSTNIPGKAPNLATSGKKLVVSSVPPTEKSEEYFDAHSVTRDDMDLTRMLENPHVWKVGEEDVLPSAESWVDDDDDDDDGEDFEDDDGDNEEEEEDNEVMDDDHVPDDVINIVTPDSNGTENKALSSDGLVVAEPGGPSDFFQEKGVAHSRHVRETEEKSPEWKCTKLNDTLKECKKDLRKAGKSQIVSETFEAEFYQMFDYATHFRDSDCTEDMPWPNVKAKACKNAGIEFKEKGTALPIYKSNKIKKKKQLFNTDTTNPGTFTTKTTGLYLVHMNITIVDETDTHFLVLHLNEKPMLACQGGGFPCPHTNRLGSTKYRICTIGGLLQLSEGDVLAIKTMENNTMVRLESHAKSYFRVVMLEGERRKKRKKRHRNKSKAKGR